MASWIHEGLVCQAVDDFRCRARVPTQSGESLTYRIEQVVPNQPDGRAFRVEADLSAGDDDDIWLALVVEVPPLPHRPYVHGLSAVRVAWHGQAHTLQRWDDAHGRWETVRDRDGG